MCLFIIPSSLSFVCHMPSNWQIHYLIKKFFNLNNAYHKWYVPPAGWTYNICQLWVRQLVIQYYRRRRFLQYNFMDPGWGAEFPTGAWPPWPHRWRRRWVVMKQNNKRGYTEVTTQLSLFAWLSRWVARLQLKRR